MVAYEVEAPVDGLGEVRLDLLPVFRELSSPCSPSNDLFLDGRLKFALGSLIAVDPEAEPDGG